MAIEHSNRAHALLAPSAAHRWLNCTPSARLEDEYGKNSTSSYAQEGTIAHELCEVRLRFELGWLKGDDFDNALEQVLSKAQDAGVYGEEMEDAVDQYVETCLSLYTELRQSHAICDIMLETPVTLTDYVPDSFGSVDCLIAADNTIYIVDFKYGKGVVVSAQHNQQMMLYALGAIHKLDSLYDIDQIAMLIVQPRANNFDRYDISAKELLLWANQELKAKAMMAFEGRGELNAGGWCQFCGVRNRCRKLYEQQLEIAKYEFRQPATLTDEELADVVLRSAEFIQWINSIREYVYKQLENGNSMPGLKLVPGRRTRAWKATEEEVYNTLHDKLHLDDEDIFTKKLNSLTTIEKLVGKKAFAEATKDVIGYKEAAPSMVPESDKRDAIVNSAVQDFEGA